MKNRNQKNVGVATLISEKGRHQNKEYYQRKRAMFHNEKETNSLGVCTSNNRVQNI